MSSSQRPSENSVLFSLRELRRIEDDRVKKEQEAARAKAEGERQAKEAADRASREAEERRAERMRLEMQHKQKHSPVKAVVSVAGVIVLIAGGVGYKMYSDHQKELMVAREEKARVELEAKKKQAELEARYAMIEKDFAEKLKKAKSQADIDQIQRERMQMRLDAQAGKTVRPHATPKADDAKKAPVVPNFKKRDIPDDPTLGL